VSVPPRRMVMKRGSRSLGRITDERYMRVHLVRTFAPRATDVSSTIARPVTPPRDPTTTKFGLSARIQPLWRSIICWHMNRPSPIPEARLAAGGSSERLGDTLGGFRRRAMPRSARRRVPLSWARTCTVVGPPYFADSTRFWCSPDQWHR
jgi:hypothetical protein